jgi:cellulose biosynthesis protein BcsQ
MEEPMTPHTATADPEALRRVVAVINSKGGVLKTSVTANVAGRLAAAGMRILVVDLDISGNLKLDFGLLDHPGEDGGKGLVDAVWTDGPFPIVKDVRTSLDFVFGGRHLEMLGVLSRMPTASELPAGSVPGEFARKLAEVADNYDLTFLDCPPGNSELQDMALAATGWVLIPTKTEQASWDGLLGVGPRVKKARVDNPALRYLGIVITAHNLAATRIRRNTQEQLQVVGETVPMFETVIRHSETAAHDCRARGQLAHELARDVVASNSQRLRALHARRVGDNVIPLPTALSGSADSLAGDYEQLAKEICDRITAAETTEVDHHAGAAR